ncbi:DNA primase [Streptomyces sp. HUAS MG91]|uniref:DNA primase n=1 Tax=Streptomyces tabacisoli TaxID=3156398 RepID=A0AAU8J173_9ACTN
MNRAALGLAVGAGYVLGRTKKMKLAFAVGTMVAGKKLKLSPRAIGELVTHQLENNPQFKEIGDQLRQDLRGVGKAATGALVERQIEGLAGRLHSRTQGVRDQIAGVAPDVDDVRDAGERVTRVVPGQRVRRRDEEDAYEDSDAYEAEPDGEFDDDSYDDRAEDRDDNRDERDDRDEGPGRGRRGGSGSSGRRTQGAERTRMSTSTAKRAPAKKTAAKKTAAKKTAGKKTAAKKTAAKRAVGSAAGAAKGGRDRG